jgi:hypothetical protein
MTHTTAEAVARIYFSDFFDVSPEVIEKYGAFDVSLINDLPLFVDPFLLFNSENPTYRQLHDYIIQYLRFLRDKSVTGGTTQGLLKAWYEFKEVKQNWLGFSQVGNRGSALGPYFARALDANLGTIFKNFGSETVTHGSHLEKVCLVSAGIGRDNISDFTTNLIKRFLLEYTQTFAQEFLHPSKRRIFNVEKTCFNYETETWETRRFDLPHFAEDFVLLTPKSILTRDEIWISRRDLLYNFEQVAAAVPNDQLRAQINNYLYSQLSRDRKMTAKERAAEKQRAIADAIRVHPEVIEYYIRSKEDTGDVAKAVSFERVTETEEWFVDQVRAFAATHLAGTEFYSIPGNSLKAARQRVLFLKHVIEDKDGYRLFYHEGKPIQRESDLQLLFKLTWFATPFDVNSEVNNGRGPADFAVSYGSSNKSLVEFKLASNSQLKKNLENQVSIYEAASDADQSLKVICYFSASELRRVQRILRELRQENNSSIILIDARSDNKPSASKA